MNNKSFSQLTNSYSISKTLRFELFPIKNTANMLQENMVFQKDLLLRKKYEKTKPFIDKLHREFIIESLNNYNLNGLEDYFNYFKAWKNLKNQQSDKANKNENASEMVLFSKKDQNTKALKDSLKKLESKESELRLELVKSFHKKAQEWSKEKYEFKKEKGLDLLFEKEVFTILKKKYGHDPDAYVFDKKSQSNISIFDSWDKFTGYFIKFFETRKNYYKADGKATAIATRIINDNLRRFCDNIILFEKLKEEIDFSEVEKEFQVSLSNFFSISYYNNCFLQEGIDTYHKILGGDVLNDGKKNLGLNEIINQNRQATGKKHNFFKALEKQISSEKIEFFEEITDLNSLYETLLSFKDDVSKKIPLIKSLLSDFFKAPDTFDLEKVYLSKPALNSIIHRWFSNPTLFLDSLFSVAKIENNENFKIKKNSKENEYSLPDFLPFSFLKKSFDHLQNSSLWKSKYYSENEDGKNDAGFLSNDEDCWNQFMKIFSHEFFSLFKRKRNSNLEEADNNEGYDFFEMVFNDLLQNLSRCHSDNHIISPKEKTIIKNYLDNVLSIYQMAKYFSLEKKREWSALDIGDFYSHPEYGYLLFHQNAYETIIQNYNKVRNFLTKKAYNEEKWKLNFENSTLASGWDQNKETDNNAVILRKNGLYYLAVMRKEFNKLFEKKCEKAFLVDSSDGAFEKMVYKLMPDPKKDLPKGVFSAKGMAFYKPSQEIINIYKNKTFQTSNQNFSKEDLFKLIDFYKSCILKHPSWKQYDFHFSDTVSYENLNDFYSEVNKDSYKIYFVNVSESYIFDLNRDGKLYLFQIKNKDFNLGSIGRKNLHTIYFLSIFSTENFQNNFPIKLCGNAELFYRPKTQDNLLVTKKDKKGNDVIDHKRYSFDKVFFHCPITLNRTSQGLKRYNETINSLLAENPAINVVGVDRGEKHLAYYSVINQKSEILESGSLNTIETSLKDSNEDSSVSNSDDNVQSIKVDYAAKLEKCAANRDQARKDWQDVEKIKNLKKGYISQVVHKLAKLAIKYNAIIVLEDLNMRFKQIRGGIEKSVYQQLEKALIDKLSFFVNKNVNDPSQPGHVLNAYQLTSPVSSFKEMGKQTGIIFYTQASYTSKIDPITGWRPNLYLKFTNAENAKKDIVSFSGIVYRNNRFEFTYDLKNFRNQKEWPKKTVWTICSSVERFRWDKKKNQNRGGYTHYENLTSKFIELFNDYGFNLNEDNLLKQIEIFETKGNERFFRDMIYYINLICQIRNTDEKATDPMHTDFILSPVEPFYDSRKSLDKNLPKNGDDNGAYNIARKGLFVLEKISLFKNTYGTVEGMKFADLYISNTEWDDYVIRDR